MSPHKERTSTIDWDRTSSGYAEHRPGRVGELPWDNNNFEVATANQCWLYFQSERVIPELRRIGDSRCVFRTSDTKQYDNQAAD